MNPIPVRLSGPNSQWPNTRVRLRLLAENLRLLAEK